MCNGEIVDGKWCKKGTSSNPRTLGRPASFLPFSLSLVPQASDRNIWLAPQLRPTRLLQFRACLTALDRFAKPHVQNTDEVSRFSSLQRPYHLMALITDLHCLNEDVDIVETCRLPSTSPTPNNAPSEVSVALASFQPPYFGV